MCPRLLIQRAALMAAVCLAGLSPGCGSKAGNAPNIVLILTDDQGWTSVSYRADPAIPESASDYIETPQMERLARQGMQFTDGYAPNPMCSPTRHSLLFGGAALADDTEGAEAGQPGISNRALWQVACRFDAR